MEYKINATGERVRLDVLANADKSIIGLQVGNCKIISMQYSELFFLVRKVMGEQEVNNFVNALFKHRCYPSEEESSVIVMETVGDLHEPEIILQSLKLYKAVDVFSCYFLSYRFMNNELHCGGIGKVYLPEHGIYWPNKRYEVTDKELLEFPIWIEEHGGICFGDYNEKFSKMKRLYLDSYLPDDTNQSFLTLFVVLEMMFGAMGELNFRISRGVGVFLSSGRDEMKEIVKSVKKLYNTRSKYVHVGNNVSYEELFELREIVRRVIVLMFEREMHKPEFNFKVFTDEIIYDGYLRG